MQSIRCGQCNRLFLPEEVTGRVCPACGAGLEIPRPENGRLAPAPAPKVSPARPAPPRGRWVKPAVLGVLALGACLYCWPKGPRPTQVGHSGPDGMGAGPTVAVQEAAPSNPIPVATSADPRSAPTKVETVVAAVPPSSPPDRAQAVEALAISNQAASSLVATPTQAVAAGQAAAPPGARRETEPSPATPKGDLVVKEAARAPHRVEPEPLMAANDRAAKGAASTLPANAVEMGPGGQLVAHLAHGSIEVVTWESNQVKAVALADNQADADAATATLTLAREGSRVTLRVPGNSKDRIRYRVQVPSKFNLDLKTVDGGILITNVEGNVKLSTSRGGVNLARINGLLTAETSSGSISLQGATGPTKLKSSSGNLTVGELGSEATVETSGGWIKVLLARDRLKAKTVGGNLQVGAALNAVRAETGGGWLKVAFSGRPQEDSQLSTQGGSLEVQLDPKLALEVNTRCPQGRFKSELPIEWQETEKNRARQGRLNGGGRRLEVKTTGGELRLLPLVATALPSAEREFKFPQPGRTHLPHVGQDPDPRLPAGNVLVRGSNRNSKGPATPKDLFATEGEPGPKLPVGLLLGDGSQVPATIVSLDEAQVAFRRAGGALESLPLDRVAVVLFRTVPEARRSLLDYDTPGLLLRNGDFVEGHAKSVQNGQAVISSVLLGLRTVSLERDAVALVVRPTKAGGSR